MYSGIILSFFRTFTVSIALLFIVQMSTSSTADATNFDIPISELNTVKKKSPAKRTTSESRKKRKSEKKSQESSSVSITSVEPVVPVEPVVRTQEKTVEADGAAKSEEPPQKPPVAAPPMATSEDFRIHHTPYSFVVTGKRTVIHAVINSRTDIQELNCSLAPPEGGAPTLIKMTKVAGTRFTYMATLPGAAPGSQALRYTFVAVDIHGKESRSQEHVTPVVSSPIVPSWQLESDAADSVKPADPVKPAEEKTPPKSQPGQ